MKTTIKAILVAALFAAVACKGTEPTGVNIVPAPASMELTEGSFRADGAAFSLDGKLDKASLETAEDFRSLLEEKTGKASGKGKGTISFVVNENLGTEEYALTITGKEVTIEAATHSGFVYATQSLKQLCPPEFFAKGKKTSRLEWPCLNIVDGPRFGYRGILIDSGRHFIPVEEVKKILDVMSFHKLNRLHWHLTEDQGWRIEIKKYPLLTEIGSVRNGTQIGKDRSTNDGVPYGGFYTQDELRDVVAYADKLGITVIPEIDLPGHMLSVLAAYPELGCTGGPYETGTIWGIMKDVLCPGNEAMFTFLEDVFTELIDIFPSEYINIGGDECPKDRWKECPKCQKLIKSLGLKDKNGATKEQFLQNYVTKRMQDFLASKGRKIIGWDEILEGELSEGATVMSWRGTDGGIEAASKGFDVIMAPYTFLYIDYYQTKERDKEPLAIGGYNPVETVYSFEPFDGIDPVNQDHILGVQANLWGEYLVNTDYLEYMLLPRLAAVSEVQWCEAGNKDFERFHSSMKHIGDIYDAAGYTWCKYMFGTAGMPGHEQPVRSPEELDTLNWKGLEGYLL